MIFPYSNYKFTIQYQVRVEVDIFSCNKINQSKSLIYVHGYNIPVIDDYGSELTREKNLSDVQKTTRLLPLHFYWFSMKKNHPDP